MFSLLFVYQPLIGNISFWFLLFFFSFPFPFLMFARLFETNFPNIPFLKPKLLSFFCCFVFVFMMYVSAFLFQCWFCFWYCLLFLSCFLFCFQSMKKTWFPLQFWCFFELCWLKGILVVMLYAFVLACLFLVLFVCSLNNEVALFSVCVVCFLFL